MLIYFVYLWVAAETTPTIYLFHIQMKCLSSALVTTATFYKRSYDPDSNWQSEGLQRRSLTTVPTEGLFRWDKQISFQQFLTTYLIKSLSLRLRVVNKRSSILV